ncbi:type II secretion system protein [Haloferula sp.]|uniref:type II secretion system protein n=1 Tax=Haloferula sp. TaxID=2497595 RepID=UPI00329F5125
MISAVKTSDTRRNGFTLLEIVVVLSIAVLIVGGGLSAMYFNRDEARLTDAYQSIEVLAKRARTISTLQQRPYALEFRDKTVSLMPFAEAAMEPSDRSDFLESREDFEVFTDEVGFIDGADEIDDPSSEPPVRDAWSADPEMMLFIRRWATSDWVPITVRDRHVWRFDPNGICEPVGIRVEVNGSWVEVVFHPLTAAITSTDSEIR